MSGFARKKPFVESLGIASRRQVANAIQLSGKSLPCHVVAVAGAIVTVAFDVQSAFTLPQVEVPIAGSEYARVPIQVGCRGVVFPCDASIGAVSGLGGDAAPDLTAPGNLSALTFFPIGNKNWGHADPDIYLLYGPNGVTIRTQDATVRIDVTRDGVVIELPNDTAVTVVGGNVVVSDGDVTAGGISLRHHVHPGVQSGGSSTGEPTG